MLCDLWALSCLIRDQTHSLGSESIRMSECVRVGARIDGRSVNQHKSNMLDRGLFISLSLQAMESCWRTKSGGRI